MGMVDISALGELDLSLVKRLLGPGVYFVYLDGRVREYLYIGSAKNLLNRISDPNHGSFKRGLAECSGISVIFTSSEAQARDVEAQWIAKVQPKFNVAGIGCSSHKKALDEESYTIPESERAEKSAAVLHRRKQALLSEINEQLGKTPESKRFHRSRRRLARQEARRIIADRERFSSADYGKHH